MCNRELDSMSVPNSINTLESSICTNKNTIIISAFICCGKTYLYRKENKYSIIDLDEEITPWPKSFTESNSNNNSNNKKRRSFSSVDFISCVKKCIGKYDFIFLPPRQPILQGLVSCNIPYILVYPENTLECYKEWERRNIERGTEWFWNAFKKQWSYFLNKMHTDCHAKAHYTLKETEYLSNILDQIYRDNIMV